MVSLFLFLFVRVQGSVTGREFSPDTFSVREFHFYEIPLLNLQITPIKRTSVTPNTATYLRQKSLIQAPKKPTDTWHLVYLSRGFTGRTPADSELLLLQLNLDHNGNAYWRQWSIDHPQHAPFFWSVIQRLAKREMYLLMPPLFELAQLEQSTEAMTEKINQSLSSQYVDLIKDMRAADRTVLADGLLKEALKDFPNDADLRKLAGSPETP
ncbi:hypothetical protein CA13_38660 [Planctomycetes bacterium CA13]|uniref:Uncharacterized protein n=1 Tax=Novipirellula herctigrandis TaxID=2527986 RepID=A0A5C5Z794_9BACT|nr:hypothetical protein CA13_38660 [Planctomycetes bacterium CA13]